MSSEVNFSKWPSALDQFLTKLTQEKEDAIYGSIYEDSDEDIAHDYSHLYQSTEDRHHFKIELKAPAGKWEEVTLEQIVNIYAACLDSCKNSEAELTLLDTRVKTMSRLSNFDPFYSTLRKIENQITDFSNELQRQKERQAFTAKLSVQVEKELQEKTTNLNTGSWLNTLRQIASLDRTTLDQFMTDQILSKTLSCLAFPFHPSDLVSSLDNLLFTFSQGHRNEKFYQAVLSLYEQLSHLTAKKNQDFYASRAQQEQKHEYKQALIAPDNVISYADTTVAAATSQATSSPQVPKSQASTRQPTPQEIESHMKAYEEMLKIFDQMRKNSTMLQESIVYLEVLQEGLTSTPLTTGAWYLNNKIMGFKKKLKKIEGFLEEFDSLNFLKAYPNLALLENEIHACLSWAQNDQGIAIKSIEMKAKESVRQSLNAMQHHYENFIKEFIDYDQHSLFYPLISEAFYQNLVSCHQVLQINLPADTTQGSFHDLRMGIRQVMGLLSERFEKEPTNGLIAERLSELSILLNKCYFIAREYKSTSVLNNPLIKKKIEKMMRTYLEPSSRLDEIWGYLRNNDVDNKKTHELETVTKELLVLISPDKNIEDEKELRTCFRAWCLANHPDKNAQADFQQKGEMWAKVYALWDKRNKLLG